MLAAASFVFLYYTIWTLLMVRLLPLYATGVVAAGNHLSA